MHRFLNWARCLRNASHSRYSRQSGFTLIELLIVAGLIGILISITSPMYEKYQRKGRQSEAKIALSSMFALQKNFYSEFSAYIPSLSAIRYSSTGGRNFYYKFPCVNDSWSGSVTGYSGPSDTNGIAPDGNPYTFTWTYVSSPNCVDPNWNCSSYGNNPQTFNMIALGQLGVGLNIDAWVISHLKVLRNCSPGT